MKILALIPARMDSSRFPGKPMAPILGKPMIGHVYERVARSPLLDLMAVATCDREIHDYIESIDGIAVTSMSALRIVALKPCRNWNMPTIFAMTSW